MGVVQNFTFLLDNLVIILLLCNKLKVLSYQVRSHIIMYSIFSDYRSNKIKKVYIVNMLFIIIIIIIIIIYFNN